MEDDTSEQIIDKIYYNDPPFKCHCYGCHFTKDDAYKKRHCFPMDTMTIDAMML